MIQHKFIGAKFPDRDAELIKCISKARGEDVSDFVRRSVMKELVHFVLLSEHNKKEVGGFLMELNHLEEIVGKLKKIKREPDGFLILNFENSHLTEIAFHHNPKYENMKFETMNSEIVVPPNSGIEEEITKFVGKKIGLLYAEDHYVIREIRGGECAEMDD